MNIKADKIWGSMVALIPLIMFIWLKPHSHSAVETTSVLTACSRGFSSFGDLPFSPLSLTMSMYSLIPLCASGVSSLKKVQSSTTSASAYLTPLSSGQLEGCRILILATADIYLCLAVCLVDTPFFAQDFQPGSCLTFVCSSATFLKMFNSTACCASCVFRPGETMDFSIRICRLSNASAL